MKESEILQYAYEKGWLNDKGKDVHIEYLLGNKKDYTERIKATMQTETKADLKDADKVASKRD